MPIEHSVSCEFLESVVLWGFSFGFWLSLRARLWHRFLSGLGQKGFVLVFLGQSSRYTLYLPSLKNNSSYFWSLNVWFPSELDVRNLCDSVFLVFCSIFCCSPLTLKKLNMIPLLKELFLSDPPLSTTTPGGKKWQFPYWTLICFSLFQYFQTY